MKPLPGSAGSKSISEKLAEMVSFNPDEPATRPPNPKVPQTAEFLRKVRRLTFMTLNFVPINPTGAPAYFSTIRILTNCRPDGAGCVSRTVSRG